MSDTDPLIGPPGANIPLVPAVYQAIRRAVYALESQPHEGPAGRGRNYEVWVTHAPGVEVGSSLMPFAIVVEDRESRRRLTVPMPDDITPRTSVLDCINKVKARILTARAELGQGPVSF